MALQLPHRTLLRRAATAAALGALVAPAAGAAPAAAKAKRSKLPTVSQVRPMQLAVGDTLEIRGRNFLRGRAKNTVVFQRDGAKAVFVKAGLSTRKLMKVELPDRLQRLLLVREGVPVATRFRIRIVAARFGKRFTRDAGSPTIGPKPLAPAPAPAPLVIDLPAVDPGPSIPPSEDPLSPVGPAGDCDGDKVLNGTDADDDADLVLDADEQRINKRLDDQGIDGGRMDKCLADTDEDGVPDGYEYHSARDLNDDEFQDPNTYLPAPEKRMYPNPLDGSDLNTDYDGDGLTLGQEYRLYRYQLRTDGVDPATLTLDTPLSYSDGLQYSVDRRDERNVRRPNLRAEGYGKASAFLAWANGAGYGTVVLPPEEEHYSILDFNRDGVVRTEQQNNYLAPESLYYDDGDGWLSDDERDEDADGLTNEDEYNRQMQPKHWASLYSRETPFHIEYRGTDPADSDTDGDGVRDGADDQDFDDVPNIAELSRNMATGRYYDPKDLKPEFANPVPELGRVNPFNPCLPNVNSRTCPRYIPFEGAWAPFDGPPWNPKGDDPDYLVHN